jgi:GGDEF-like domain/PucR C-terminal helix-turn-helix domain
MADRSRYDDEVVSKSAAAIVDRLGEQLADITQAIQQILERDIAELRGDAQLLGLLHKSTEGNVETVFNALHYDIPIERVEPPTAALEYARRLAQHGVPSNALVRAYRLGHQALLAMVVDAINEADLDPALGLAVFDRMTAVTFRYIDWISQNVVNVYETERDRWLENRSRIRSVRVAEILEGGDVDVDAMTSAIRYPLRRTHVALVLWFANDSNTGNELARLERCLRELAEHLDSGNALFVEADRVSGWGWIPLANAGGDPIARIRRRISDTPDAPYVAVGAALSGVHGFRRSHRQAQNARRVAVAAGPAAPRVTAASDPGLFSAALVSTDLAEAQAWVRETLGPLATDSENDALLRETLRVFLHEGCSYKAAADDLNLHSNSVKYRVQRAVDRRGRQITDDRLDVELALLVCHWFGAEVLEPDRRAKRTAR